MSASLRAAMGAATGTALGLLAGSVAFRWLGNLPINDVPLLEFADTLRTYAWYYGSDPYTRGLLLKTGSLIPLGTVGGAIAGLVAAPTRPLHGAARFASRRDIRKAGLLSDDGIAVGRLGWRHLRLGGSQHVFLSAPTRSGKGAAVVVPTLLTWQGSAVVLDVKRENWSITAGWRSAQGQPCYLFDPLGERTHRYNPLGYVSDDPAQRIDDLQKIGAILFPDRQGVDPIWTAGPRALFLGMALFLFEAAESLGEPVTFGSLYRLTKRGDLVDWLAKHLDSGAFSSTCVGELREFLGTPDRTRGGILKSFTAVFELWANPRVDAATSANDFDLRELRSRPMSIYLGISPPDLDRLSLLLNLFVQQAIALHTRETSHDTTCLFVLDEFAALGKVAVIERAIPFTAGYGLRFLIVCQSPAQVRSLYGRDGAETLLQNCGLHVLYAPKDHATADDISKTLGDETVEVRNRSWSHGGNRSTSASMQRRPLLLAQEVKDIGPDAVLLIHEGQKPIKARKDWYFRSRLYRGRLMPAPLIPPLVVKHQPSSVQRPPAAVTITTKAGDDPSGPPGPPKRGRGRPRKVKEPELETLALMLDEA